MDTPKTRRENEVWQACDDLWALNANLEALKGDAIRDQLLSLGYKKGSPNEIYKYRSSWKESRGISEKSLAESVQVADPISRAVSLVYEQMHKEAQEKISAIQCDSSSQIETLTGQNQTLIQAHETMLQKYETLESEHEALKTAHELLRDATQKLSLKLEGCELLLSELKSTYTPQIAKLEEKTKSQGLEFSEALNQAKLETRQERDSRLRAEFENQRLNGQITRLQNQLENHALKAEKLRSKTLQQELSKMTLAIKRLKLAPKKSSRGSKSRPGPKLV